MLRALLSPDELALQEEARAFACSVPAKMLRQMDAEEVVYPREYLSAAAEQGLLGLRFDPRWGGRGLSWTAEVAALEEIGVLGSALACLYSLPSIVGEAISRFGSEEQAERFLEPTLAGELCCAEALTEPRGGSDFFGATTKAVRRGDVYVLNGQERFIVGGEGADYFLVYARTGGPEARPQQSISVFLVERDRGVRVEHVYGLLGSRGGGTARILFRDVEVPVANLIGEENQGGEIFNRMMIPERITSAAGALGMARAGLEVAARYSDHRKAFGQRIRRFQGVSFRIADSISRLEAAEALLYAAARSVDLGLDSRRIVSEAKKVATETAWEVVNHAMQVMGGIGYTNVFPIERYLRDLRLTMIWTGSNEIMSLLIQHEYYKEILGQERTTRQYEMDATGCVFQDEIVYE